jgi:methyltransferase family protein
MNLSANYNVGLRDLFGPSAPKNETFFGVPSAFALANIQVGFESTRCTGPQKYPRIPKHSTLRIGSYCLFFFAFVNLWPQPIAALFEQYESHSKMPSDINEHLPVLRELAKECSTAVEIGVNEIVSTWGILQGLSESKSDEPSYIGIDLKYPVLNRLFLASQLAEAAGVSFQFIQENDCAVDLEPTDLLFIDSWHTYRHLTYELEKFAPKVKRYIAMHDTSEQWGEEDEPWGYIQAIPAYPPHISQTKQGLWAAVVDFLSSHPEWRLKERRLNNHGFTVLERVESSFK